MPRFFYNRDNSINYEIRGCGPIPILFLHGFAASLATWGDLWPLLPSHRYTFYLLDLKGFGFSSKPRDGAYGVWDHAAIVKEFIAAHRLSQMILVGHSYGGAVALVTLLREINDKASCVSKLVLLASSAYPQALPRSLRLLQLPLLGQLVAWLPVPLMVKYTLNYVFYDRSLIEPKHIERYSSTFARRGMSYVLRQSARQLVPADHASIIGAYRNIPVPTLIIWGEKDRIVPLGGGTRLHREIRGSRLEIIPDCGHNPHEECPSDTARFINEFLEESDE